MSNLIYLYLSISWPDILTLFFLRAELAAYGGSQARGRPGAPAAGIRYSHTRSKHRLWPTPSSWQCCIPNPLSKARDWTHIFVDTSLILNPLSHSENSSLDWFLRRTPGCYVFLSLCSRWEFCNGFTHLCVYTQMVASLLIEFFNLRLFLSRFSYPYLIVFWLLRW